MAMQVNERRGHGCSNPGGDYQYSEAANGGKAHMTYHRWMIHHFNLEARKHRLLAIAETVDTLDEAPAAFD